jgi:hypothetical protein
MSDRQLIDAVLWRDARALVRFECEMMRRYDVEIREEASVLSSARRLGSTMVATMPKDELVRIERQLLQRTPADGVAYLRSTVLSPSRLPS